MKKAKLFGLGAIALSAGLLLSACGNGGSDSTDSTGGNSASGTATAALIQIQVASTTVHSTSQLGKG